MTYKLVPLFNPDNTESVGVIRLPHLLLITENEDNADYQAYLAWVAEGNTAEEWSPNGNQ
jgi:hypothetical protein